MADLPPDVSIRPAAPDERAAVETVLDAAMLAYGDLEDPLSSGDVLVAVSDGGATDDGGTILGALVATRPDPDRRRIDAIAVRPNRRGRGIGSALVDAEVERAMPSAAERVVAEFDADVAPFYRGLNFVVEPAPEDPDRRVGVRYVGREG